MMRYRHLLNKVKAGINFWMNSVLIFVLIFGCSNPPEIRNPYEQVNWEKHEQYKANFHTHTTRSDGIFSPQAVVDMYKEHGYSILAITDHNTITYPWTDFKSLKPSAKSIERIEAGMIENSELIYENRKPENMGMIAIKGNEISSPQHLGSYFTNIGQRSDSIEEILNSTKDENGILMFNHPGKYKRNVLWYSSYFRDYNHIIGIEVYNQGNRYPTDRQLWDSILVNVMPERPVWGFSNDDFHGKGLGRNSNILILPELNTDWVRKGMTDGLFFFVYAPSGHDGASPPRIDSISIDKKNALIKIMSAEYDSIRWISNGKVIERGNKIQLDNNFNGNYIRAEIFGKDGTMLGTQPFGVVHD